MTTQAVTGADILVQQLQARGVNFITVLCGNGLNPLLYAAERAGLRLVDMHNEQAASFLADAYARLSGRMAVCVVSSGVAHVHAFAGLLNARYDGAPMLLISGCSESSSLGRGGFQDLDQVSLARPLCKRAEMVTRAERIPQAVQESFAAAMSGRPGPVHLTIPVDVLGAMIVDHPAQDPPASSPRGAAFDGGLERQRMLPDEATTREAVRMLSQASRPLIVAGTGAFYDGAGPALQRFAQQAHVPVVTPIWDRGVMSQPDGFFLGVVGAASGEPRLLTQADLLILVGVRVDYRLRYLDTPPLLPSVRIVRIDADPAELGQGVEPDLAMLADCRTALERLSIAWEELDVPTRGLNHSRWLQEARAEHARFYRPWMSVQGACPGSDTSEQGVDGGQLIAALRQVITEEIILLIDGGNIGQWAHMALCHDRYPANWLTCGASAVVGWGVPGAMAARLCYPDRPVILLSGDGAIGFGLMELESAARQGLPFVVVLADDRAWGIVVSGQQKGCGHTVASELSAIDYAQVARGLGAQGLRVESTGTYPSQQISAAIRGALGSAVPTLIHVPTRRGGPAD